eukprot:1147947-Pelagomonas_calceolata.AAC.9
MEIWRVTGSTRLQNLAVRSVVVRSDLMKILSSSPGRWARAQEFSKLSLSKKHVFYLHEGKLLPAMHDAVCNCIIPAERIIQRHADCRDGRTSNHGLDPCWAIHPASTSNNTRKEGWVASFFATLALGRGLVLLMTIFSVVLKVPFYLNALIMSIPPLIVGQTRWQKKGAAPYLDPCTQLMGL